MAIQPVTPVTLAPVPGPQRGDESTFDDRMDASIRWFEISPEQFNNLAYGVNNNATEAAASAAASEQSHQSSYYWKNQSEQYAVSANNSAQTAVAKAGEASASAAAAKSSADAAAAVSGLPNPAGKANYKMVVNADGTAYTLAVDGAALGYNPVRQGTAPGQIPGDKVEIGRASISDYTLSVYVRDAMTGYMVLSSTPSHIKVTHTVPVQAPTFTGTHIGDGSQISGMSQSQIITALGYTPARVDRFAYGGTMDTGRAIDLHFWADGVNDFDAKIKILAPSVTNSNGTSDVVIDAPAVYIGETLGGRGDLYAATAYASYFSGDGRFLTNFTWNQITAGLGFVPINQNDAITNGKLVVATGPSNFDANEYNTLRVYQPSGNPAHSAHMEFVRAGFYGIKIGLDASNTFAIGGYSQGNDAYRFSITTAGDAVAAGNVTASSDMRFKDDLQPITGAVEKLLSIEHGGFEYLDNRTLARKYGVSAQAVRKVFPHAVVMDAKGFLSVAYGQLALALLAEVTREFDQRLAAQQQQIDQLIQLVKGK